MIISKLIAFSLIIITSGCSTINFSKSSSSISSPIYKAWNQTYWGMSKQELVKLFPGKIATIEESKKWSDYYYRGTKSEINNSCLSMRSEENCEAFGMQDFDIANKKYNVFFYFTNNQLSRIRLICDGEGDNNFMKGLNCFSDMNLLLIQKYGSPVKSEEKEIPSSENKYMKISMDMKKWKTEYMNIVLQYSGCFGCENDYRDSVSAVSYFPDTQKVPIKSNFYEREKNKI